jgi:hypothetical protein
MTDRLMALSRSVMLTTATSSSLAAVRSTENALP